MNLVGFGNSANGTVPTYPALAQQNAPASTVLLFEIQKNFDNFNNAPNLTSVPLETVSGSSNGSNDGSCGTSSGTGYCKEVYATGQMGGHTNLNRGTLTGNGTVTAHVKSVFVDLVVTSGDSVLFQSRPRIGRACVSAQVVGIKMTVTAACENRLGSR